MYRRHPRFGPLLVAHNFMYHQILQLRSSDHPNLLRALLHASTVPSPLLKGLWLIMQMLRQMHQFDLSPNRSRHLPLRRVLRHTCHPVKSPILDRIRPLPLNNVFRVPTMFQVTMHRVTGTYNDPCPLFIIKVIQLVTLSQSLETRHSGKMDSVEIRYPCPCGRDHILLPLCDSLLHPKHPHVAL